MERCSACGNDLIYNPSSHSLLCKSCKNTKQVDFERCADIKVDYNASDETNEMIFKCECQGCGNLLSFDKSSISFKCPYCGKSAILDNFKYDIMAIIPFQIGHDGMEMHYKKWVSSKIFAPNALKKVSFIDKFEGHFLPCYVFDAKTNTKYSGTYAEHRTRTVGSGKNIRVETYTVYRNFSGTRNDSILDDMVIGSEVINNTLLSTIEPYDYDKLEKYNEYFLYGYTVDNYTKNLSDAFDMAKGEIENIISTRIKRESMKNIVSLDCNVNYNNVLYARYLLPLYMCQMNYKGKLYSFYMNGQTGKVYGNTPVSAWKVAVLIVLILIFVCVFTYLFMYA